MLQFSRSLSTQSKPLTLTAGLFPKFSLTQPPFLREVEVGDDDDDKPDGGGIGIGINGDIGESFSSPDRAS